MPPRRIIGFDFDDVLSDFMGSFVDYHNKKYGTSYQVKDCITFDLKQVFKCTDEEIIERVWDFHITSRDYLSLPIPGSVEGIKTLSNGNTLYIVTSRNEYFRDIVCDWLNKYLPNYFKGVHFTNQAGGAGIKRTKGEVCIDLSIEVFVDDSLENAKDISEKGIPVLLYDTPWNQKFLNPLVTRVHSWKEVVDRLNN